MNGPLTPETLAELRRLLDEAPPLPYRDRAHAYGDPSNGPEFVALEAQHEGRWEKVAVADYDKWGGMGLALAAAAVNALPVLLDAAERLAVVEAERDALTVAQPCVLRAGEVYDFGWCETHDRTFALGSTCDHGGLSEFDYLDKREREQRQRAIRALDELERVTAERDALAASVARVRDLHKPHPCDVQHSCCTTCNDRYPCRTIRALDGGDR